MTKHNSKKAKPNLNELAMRSQAMTVAMALANGSDDIDRIIRTAQKIVEYVRDAKVPTDATKVVGIASELATSQGRAGLQAARSVLPQSPE